MKDKLAAFEEAMIRDLLGPARPRTPPEIDNYFARARSMVREWGASLDRLPLTRTKILYRLYWRGYNRRDRIPE
jgi:hypothetical protein